MLERIKELLGMKEVPNDQYHAKIKKIPWDHTFLLEALAWSKRSHDPDTQNGCIIVRNNRILSTGYNGFIRNIDDSMLPNQRPYKYEWMIHAEQNAIFNAARNGVSTDGATAYVTMKPCLSCFQFLWQAGIDKIVYSNMGSSKHFHSVENDNKLEALLTLINGYIDPFLLEMFGEVYMPQPKRFTMNFIDKSLVLPNENDD